MADIKSNSSSYLGFVSGIAVPSCWADSLKTDKGMGQDIATQVSQLDEAKRLFAFIPAWWQNRMLIGPH